MMNMSEAARHLLLAELGAPAGFRSDARFVPAEPAPPPEPQPQSEDPVALAYAEGFAAGAAEARAEAQEQMRIEAEVREALSLSLTRLDHDMTEELRLRLRDTVAALCEAAIAPLALDEAALLTRISRAVDMLARADDERVIRMNPDDLALVAPRLRQDWNVQADAALARGAIRVEGTNGGVEDGPEQWRRAIAEAMDRC